MTKQSIAVLLLIITGFALGLLVAPGAVAQDEAVKEPTRLAVVWTSDDPLLAHRMLLMYVGASQRAKWFDENLIIIWGPSAKLVSEDQEIQAKIQSMMKSGVTFQACVACASMYGVSDDLRALGIEVKGMGAPLTKILQDDGWDVMTF